MEKGSSFSNDEILPSADDHVGCFAKQNEMSSTQDDRPHGLRGNIAMEFKIFCSNKDLDGTLLQGVAFDAWVPLKPALTTTGSFASLRTKVWYSSSGNILPVLQQEIKKKYHQAPDFLATQSTREFYKLKGND